MSIIYTNSAIEAIKRNNISKDILEYVIHNYDKKFPGDRPGTFIFNKATTSGFISLIGKHEGNNVVVIGCRVKKPQGSVYKKNDPRYKNISFWKRVWLDILSTFGL